MIGNDIVDLNASRRESNWQRKGWMQKVFSPEEQSFIEISQDKERIVWLLWSMKEAAYKIFNRTSKKSFYAPQAFLCSLLEIKEGAASGDVIYKDVSYYTYSILRDDYIHTIAKAAMISKDANVSIVNHNSNVLKLPDSFSLNKDNSGVPYLFNAGTGQYVDASLSHHGDYLALVF